MKHGVFFVVFFFLLIAFAISQNINQITINEISDINLSSGKLMRIENFPSKYIQSRNVDVWLPDNYSENRKYAVLYMHDGQMLFDAATTWNKQEWKVDEIASRLIYENKTKDFIVVAIWNIPETRHSDYFPQKPFEALTRKTQDSIFFEAQKNNKGLQLAGVNSDHYLKFIVQEIKPFVDTNFSTHSNKENAVILGSSMGGLISMYAICEYPEVFGAAACLSTHWIGTYSNHNNPIPKAFFKYMDENLPDFQTHKLYFDYGTETLDEMYLPYQNAVDKLLKKHHYDANLKFEGADHSENSWNQRLDIPLTFLLGNKVE
jgi:predicted alpha/beta superfamily hydrolase